jgi:hypothetical protein
MIETTAGQFAPATKRTVTVQHAVFDGTHATAKAIMIYARERGTEIEYHPPVLERVDGSDEVREVAPAHLEVVTLEGRMVGDVGDVIIEGVNGEFYPCKPDIFEKTYTLGDEPVLDGAVRPVEISVHQGQDTWPFWLVAGIAVAGLVAQIVAIGILVKL